MTNAAPPDEERDIRPVVRTAPATNAGLWLFGVIVLGGGLLLFQSLNARRMELAAPATRIEAGHGAAIASPPPLALPPRWPDADPGYAWRDATEPLAAAPAAPVQAYFPQQAVTRIAQRSEPAPGLAPQDQPRTSYVGQAPVLIERPAMPAAATPVATPAPDNRVTASRLLNPSLTVPQGMIIPAVLETALDSTRPGAVRAIVSRDVMSFDGSRVLLPRGSRLYGEYAADLGAGQKRALVRWMRLTRPDAVIIQLDSPAADPLGRAGVAGKVDSHFFARFGSAILQSVLDIGVGIATRSVTDDAVILAMPGSTQQIAGQQQAQAQVQPTLRVKQGTSVSVFVARDLDFSTVDR